MVKTEVKTAWNGITFLARKIEKSPKKYGLVVELCGDECHRNGREAVHNNADIMQYLHEYGQLKAMQENHWTTEEFIKEFGVNYLEVTR